jgi:spermidine/putrescine transport system permease protein
MPVIVILIFSFGELGTAGAYRPGFTLENYARLPTRLKAFTNTLMLAPFGTIICVIISYPLAYYLAVRAGPRSRTLMLTLVIVPFWTSFLIRTYAWIFILGGKGIPALMSWMGLPEVRLLNTPFAVLLGIVYGYLPLMVFPIYVSLEKLDKRLLEASADLGATSAGTFRQVTLPLSMPGLITGSLLVFILLMGEYLIPAVLGGGKVFFVGNALVDLFLQSRNWPLGSAVAVSLVVIMLTAIALYLLAVGRERGRSDVSLV